MNQSNHLLNRRALSRLLLCGPLLPSSLCVGDVLSSKNSSSLSLKKNVVLISVNLGFLPNNFTPDRDSLESRYLSKFSDVHGKMTVFIDIEQPERLGGHRNHPLTTAALVATVLLFLTFGALQLRAQFG